MNALCRKLASAFASGGLAATLVAAAPTPAAAASNFTCEGGGFLSPITVPAGEYQNLTIAGICAVYAGDVGVKNNLIVLPGGLLIGLFAHSKLTVGGNLIVQPGASVALGCDPEELACFDDPSATSDHRIGGNLTASGATLVIVHDNTIDGQVTQSGGGGGLACTPVFPGSPPVYVDYAANKIGGGATVTGLRTCWDGFSHNTVAGSVNLIDNQTVIDDGNLADGNTIAGHLNCFNDLPAPHLSDGPNPLMNTVTGGARSQCAAISV